MQRNKEVFGGPGVFILSGGHSKFFRCEGYPLLGDNVALDEGERLMYIECKQNFGFEDQLTEQAVYRIKEMGENSYLIENDKQQERWYGRQHFLIKVEHA